jgi:hypothetical protein
MLTGLRIKDATILRAKLIRPKEKRQEGQLDREERTACKASATPAVADLESLSNVLIDKDRVSVRVDCDKTGGSRGCLVGFAH